MDADPIQFTLKVQRIVVIMASLSFLGLTLVFSFLDPFIEANMWIFLFLLICFLGSLFSLLNFWWVFSIIKKILTIDEVQKLLYHSFFLSLCSVSGLVFYITNNFNATSLSGLLVIYILYRYWVKT
jgi:hypothetical protein